MRLNDINNQGVNPMNIITLDGPSGVGKGTMARMLSTALGWHLLDSGLIYRVLGYVADARGLNAHDEEALLSICTSLSNHNSEIGLSFRADGVYPVALGENRLGPELRSEAVGSKASELAAVPSVRQALLELQRAFARKPGLIADGRDMNWKT